MQAWWASISSKLATLLFLPPNLTFNHQNVKLDKIRYQHIKIAKYPQRPACPLLGFQLVLFHFTLFFHIWADQLHCGSCSRLWPSTWGHYPPNWEGGGRQTTTSGHQGSRNLGMAWCTWYIYICHCVSLSLPLIELILSDWRDIDVDEIHNISVTSTRSRPCGGN